MKNENPPAGSAAPAAARTPVPDGFYRRVALGFQARASLLGYKPGTAKYDRAEVEFVVGAMTAADAMGFESMPADSFVPVLIMTNRFVEVFAKKERA